MNLDYKKKYLKYKNKYLDLKKQVGGGTGRDIISLLLSIIKINDSSGTRAVEDYLKSNNITLHDDSTNTAGIEVNIRNIYTIIGMFNEKYAGRLEEGYTDFDEYAIGSYVCLDAQINALTDFLTIDNPFKTGVVKEQILGLAFNKLITRLCNDLDNNKKLNYYRKYNNINNIKIQLKSNFDRYIPKYISIEEINDFVDKYIQDYTDKDETNILDCDGTLKRLREIEENKKMIKKDISEIHNMTILEKGTILLGNNDEELGKIEFDNHFPKNNFGFHTNNGWVLKSNVRNIIVKE
jgi:hypothetical protein